MTDDICAVLDGECDWAVVHGDCLEVMASLPALCVDHVITDPPYSETVHKNARTSGRGALPDKAAQKCRQKRRIDIDFAHLDADTRQRCAREFARLARRWVLAFSDVESCHGWRQDLETEGLRYKRTGAWVRLGGAPQFTGDRPASGFEAITMAHRPKGRSRWNGGGRAATYTHPVVANRLGQRGSRHHPTQKPLGLMLQLVELFSDPGDLILDPFGGSATTGVAALRLGRRVIVVEQRQEWAELCRERLEAETRGLDLVAAKRGQISLFERREAV